jgi:DNA polymerase-3 subunit gamma/tau
MSLVLNDMMEWTHWATRGKIAPGSMENAPYTPDQKKRTAEIVAGASLNTLSRVWQVMVAGAAEMKAAGNPKQSFDMLVVRMINISDLPPLSQILAESAGGAAAPTAKAPATAAGAINSASDLSGALSADKEIVMLAEWNNNAEVLGFADGAIKLRYGGSDNNFLTNLNRYLKNKTGRAWAIETAESENRPTVIEEARAEMNSDPLVADALNLFGDASVISIK